MSNQAKLLGTNPFSPLVTPPIPSVTDYHKVEDDFILDFAEIDKVKMTGNKDTDFIIEKEVREVSRVNRQDYINSYRDDVGILNIIEKVRLSGDVSLLNQTGRVGVPGVEKDALDRPVEDIADFSNYQIDKIEALNAYKKGREVYTDLPEDLKKKGSFEGLAKMSDEDITKYIDAKVASIIALQSTKKEGD